MQTFKSIITVIFGFAASLTAQAQDTIAKTMDETVSIDYEQFKRMDDKQMSVFLKEFDPENYEIFRLGEIKKRTAKKLLIPGIVISGVGGASLALVYGIIPLFSFVSYPFNLLFLEWWWGKVAPWFWKVGVSVIAMGQPFIIASIALRKQGGDLKRQAKNNYENKFFKSNTTSLNFNFYPNGFGVSLKF